VRVAERVLQRLRALGLDDATSLERCLAFVNAKAERRGAEVSVEDLVLVWGVLEGHRKAWNEVDRTLHALSTRAAGRALEVSELVQRVRTRLLVAPKGHQAKIGTYDGRGRLNSWLWTAVRLEWLQAKRGLASAATDDLDVLRKMVHGEASPEHRARTGRETKFVTESLKEALLRLEPKERTLLRMRFVDGVSAEDLGRLFQVHRTTAQRWIEGAQRKILHHMRSTLATRAKLPRDEVDALVREVAESISLRLSQVLRRDEIRLEAHVVKATRG
jgi:RNA polymerase sigma-70 factor (ECF subfamily)